MGRKEPPLMQEIGPKKYYEKVRKANSEYDKYKAGKINPKTGEYYHRLGATPKESNISGSLLGYVECITENCDNYFAVKRNTASIICKKCNCLNSFSKELKQDLEKIE